MADRSDESGSVNFLYAKVKNEIFWFDSSFSCDDIHWV